MKRQKTLIVGPQGSGKTRLANEMVKSCGKSVKRLRAAGFSNLKSTRGLQAVIIDEIPTVKILISILKHIINLKIAVICIYQGKMDDIPIATQNYFENKIEFED